jgi:hypothetical protein
VSEWLDIMLEEIARKQREAKSADEEAERRKRSADQSLSGKQSPSTPSQSK